MRKKVNLLVIGMEMDVNEEKFPCDWDGLDGKVGYFPCDWNKE